MTTLRPTLKHPGRLPDGAGERLRRRPVRPRDAATLILVRSARTGPEVLMGRRTGRHRFMPGAFVFPGGTVDPGDAHVAPARAMAPETLRHLARAGGERMAHALAMTAIRETFEETGLVLARAGDLGKTGDASWRAMKARGLAPDLGVLRYLGRAITPPESPIRFRARFLIADAEHAEGALGGSGELVNLRWVRLEAALSLPIADVTEFMLGELGRTLAAAPAERARRPLFRYRAGRAVITYA